MERTDPRLFMDGTLEESLVDYSSSLTIYSTKDASVLNYGYTISFSSTQAYVGIAENGSFGLIHSIETVGDLVGTRVVRRYLVDGVEVSDEEFQDIQKSMGIVSNDVTPRWCHLIGSYTSESEAKGGMKPSNSVEQNNSEFYVYPREMVQQVEDTKKLLQDRIGGRGSAQDDADAEAVVAREITETVEVPTFYTGYDKSDGTERHTWGYLEITEGASDDVLSAINETLHDEYEDVKGGSGVRTNSWTKSVRFECTRMPSYTEEQKRKAVETVEECGGSVTRAIRRLGYPSRQTMYQWLNQRDASHERRAGRPWSHYDPGAEGPGGLVRAVGHACGGRRGDARRVQCRRGLQIRARQEAVPRVGGQEADRADERFRGKGVRRLRGEPRGPGTPAGARTTY